MKKVKAITNSFVLPDDDIGKQLTNTDDNARRARKPIATTTNRTKTVASTSHIFVDEQRAAGTLKSPPSVHLKLAALAAHATHNCNSPKTGEASQQRGMGQGASVVRAATTSTPSAASPSNNSKIHNNHNYGSSRISTTNLITTSASGNTSRCSSSGSSVASLRTIISKSNTFSTTTTTGNSSATAMATAATNNRCSASSSLLTTDPQTSPVIANATALNRKQPPQQQHAVESKLLLSNNKSTTVTSTSAITATTIKLNCCTSPSSSSWFLSEGNFLHHMNSNNMVSHSDAASISIQADAKNQLQQSSLDDHYSNDVKDIVVDGHYGHNHDDDDEDDGDLLCCALEPLFPLSSGSSAASHSVSPHPQPLPSPLTPSLSPCNYHHSSSNSSTPTGSSSLTLSTTTSISAIRTTFIPTTHSSQNTSFADSIYHHRNYQTYDPIITDSTISIIANIDITEKQQTLSMAPGGAIGNTDKILNNKIPNISNSNSSFEDDDIKENTNNSNTNSISYPKLANEAVDTNYASISASHEFDCDHNHGYHGNTSNICNASNSGDTNNASDISNTSDTSNASDTGNAGDDIITNGFKGAKSVVIGLLVAELAFLYDKLSLLPNDRQHDYHFHRRSYHNDKNSNYSEQTLKCPLSDTLLPPPLLQSSSLSSTFSQVQSLANYSLLSLPVSSTTALSLMLPMATRSSTINAKNLNGNGNYNNYCNEYYKSCSNHSNYVNKDDDNYNDNDEDITNTTNTMDSIDVCSKKVKPTAALRETEKGEGKKWGRNGSSCATTTANVTSATTGTEGLNRRQTIPSIIPSPLLVYLPYYDNYCCSSSEISCISSEFPHFSALEYCSSSCSNVYYDRNMTGSHKHDMWQPSTYYFSQVSSVSIDKDYDSVQEQRCPSPSSSQSQFVSLSPSSSIVDIQQQDKHFLLPECYSYNEYKQIKLLMRLASENRQLQSQLVVANETIANLRLKLDISNHKLHDFLAHNSSLAKFDEASRHLQLAVVLFSGMAVALLLILNF